MSIIDNEKNLKIKLSDIQTIGMSFNKIKSDDSITSNYNILLNLTHDVLLEDNTVIVSLEIKVVDSSSQSDICDSTLKFAYIIENLNDFLISDNGEKGLEPSLSSLINGVSISTARGIVFMQSQSYQMKNIILPIFDLSKLQKKH